MWCSEFSDIFDAEHFKETLKDDVRIVSSLPSTHIMFRPTEEKNTPLDASPRWLRAHYAKRVSTSSTRNRGISHSFNAVCRYCRFFTIIYKYRFSFGRFFYQLVTGLLIWVHLSCLRCTGKGFSSSVDLTQDLRKIFLQTSRNCVARFQPTPSLPL